jgi:hypothetical protein
MYVHIDTPAAAAAAAAASLHTLECSVRERGHIYRKRERAFLYVNR